MLRCQEIQQDQMEGKLKLIIELSRIPSNKVNANISLLSYICIKNNPLGNAMGNKFQKQQQQKPSKSLGINLTIPI